MLQGYQWPVIAWATAAYVLDRRVPDLAPANLRARLGADSRWLLRIG